MAAIRIETAALLETVLENVKCQKQRSQTSLFNGLLPLAIQDEAIVREQGAGWTAALRQAQEFLIVKPDHH